jgi:capsular exopolysaccharide synthesis family protein
MSSHHVSTLSDYLRIVRRRAWIVVVAALAVTGVALGLSMRQEKLYRASSGVLLSQQNLAAALTGIQDPSVNQDQERFVQTQIDLAQVPAITARVARAAGVDAGALGGGRSSVFGKDNSDILVFQVENSNRPLAARLATEYARQFTHYRTELDTAALARARKEATARLRALKASGDGRSSIYSDLAKRTDQLATLQTLQTSNAFLVRPAGRARQVQPRMRQAAIMGLGLGLVFGIALAFLRESLDTRVRSASDIADRLHLALLGRIPSPPRRRHGHGGTLMVTEPRSPYAEAFRVLRTNLEFTTDLATLERSARSIMVTSSVSREGKSTTVSNLAVALARSGQRVVLVDLDLRRPALASLFGLEAREGLTDVVLGHVTLESALTSIDVFEHDDSSADRRSEEGTLQVLTTGRPPPDPGEFVGTHALLEILDALRSTADWLLIDTPPLLTVGDAMTLSPLVDGMVIVTRLKTIHRGTLAELGRVLAGAPVAKLGVVVTGADSDKERYRYGYEGYEGTSPGQRYERASPR